MCQRQENTCGKRKKVKQVCARGKRIHAREGEIMDWVCARGEGTHAREGEIMDQICARGEEIHAKREKR